MTPKLKTPKSSISEVLFELIRRKEVSCRTFPYPGFRARLSQIRKDFGISLKTEIKSDKNKFGNPYQYAVHKLPEKSREKAIKLYLKLVA